MLSLVGAAIALIATLLGLKLIQTRKLLSACLNDGERVAGRLALSEEQLVYMEVISPTILFEMQVDGNRLVSNWISKNLTRITGYSVEEALEPLWWEKHVYKDDRNRLINEFHSLFSEKYHVYEYRFYAKNGSLLWIRDEIQVICDKQGSPYHVLSAWSDVTRRKKEELDLRIAAIAFETDESIIITDKHARIVRVNGAFSRMTGYSKEEVIGTSPRMLQSGRHSREFYQNMRSELSENLHWEGEIWDRHKNGSVFPVWLSITAVTDGNGEITHYVSTCFDISKRKEAEEYIKNLAFYDSLTHLPNRRLMLDRLNLAMTVSQRTNQHGALMFMDLDRFKILNDTQGHDIGDQLLIEVAKRIQACIREGDTVARMGGDEFVVMLENLSKNQEVAAIQTQAVAEKICEALMVTYFLQSNNNENPVLIEHNSSASIGLVLFLGHDISCEELLKRADLAMYQAKHAGSSSIRMFDPAMQSALNERAAIEADLRQSLNRNELTLHYQMQVDKIGRPVGAEAFLCWNHPLRGCVPTEKFIPLAEETGLMLQIGKWVVRQGCATLASWNKNPVTCDLELALNISPRQFRQSDFVEHLLSAIKETGANPKRLILEITELAVMENLDAALEKMSVIREFGIRFALDDFGTGFSSLSNLLRLPLDQLKIDRSFIGQLSKDTEDEAVIRNILLLGKSQHLTVIAEGVETDLQKCYLIEHGCSFFQGYFFGKPMPLAEFEEDLFKHVRSAEIHQILSN